MDIIRIFLVEDHQIVRAGLRRMLELEPDLQVVGEASNGEEALEQLEQLTPDIVITDIQMPRMDGIEFTRRVKQEQPECQVLVLTMYEEYFEPALQAGAVGYLLKDIHREDLVSAIRSIREGRSPLHLSMQRDRLKSLASGGASTLSEREQDTLRLVAKGVTTDEIARQLSFSETTVKRTIRNVLDKMGVHNRSEAVAEAIRRNLI